MRFGSLVLGASAIVAASATAVSNKVERSAVFRCKACTLFFSLPKEQQPGVGTNVAGAEFGEDVIPGEEGTDYTWPNTTTIELLIYGGGLNTFRIPFLMERLAPNGLTEPFDEDYLGNLVRIAMHIIKQHSIPVLDPHNYGRYNGEIIDSPEDFKAFWKRLATTFKVNDKVIFDVNNEFHDMDQDLVFDLNQAAIDGIRSAGAENHWIWAEGNSYSGAWTWAEVNDNLKKLTDPSSRTVFEMHQYLDKDGSGTSEECVSETIGRERLASATAWLEENGQVGVLGEFAGASNDVCKDAVKDMLAYLSMNNGVWWGLVWWSAGPWWEDYMFSIEPGTGPAHDWAVPTLAGYS
ncbi:hypothetical protein FQN54_002337 [Arachnomyces sp. PD_36]|nr:hypothetical protein FQN54_002337 [Arachnomyces sp. PD_36]